MQEIRNKSSRRRVATAVTSHILILMAMVGPIYGAPMAMPSESDSPSTDSRNSLGMLLIEPRSPGFTRANDSDSDDAFTLLFSRSVMAEMPPSVENRGLRFSPDPNIIVVRGCRGDFRQDPTGACRQLFAFPSYPPTTTRPRIPSRQPNPRIVSQSQRDLVKKFNPSRRRWFGRSLSSGESDSSSSSRSSSRSSSSPSSSSSSSSSANSYEENIPTGSPFVYSTTESPTSSTPSTTTPDCDD
ncbi:uncharacterized protein [Palaemon carinicauda]|uniref:uncharacterized protein isoform X2 n=1 Tax=Palaemon carinicauda TaxID=392227 RepID=UPI0035B687FD